jgi:hypothetical protein
MPNSCTLRQEYSNKRPNPQLAIGDWLLTAQGLVALEGWVPHPAEDGRTWVIFAIKGAGKQQVLRFAQDDPIFKFYIPMTPAPLAGFTAKHGRTRVTLGARYLPRFPNNVEHRKGQNPRS